MTTPAIQVQDLCKSFGPVLAVDHINFEVPAGQLVGFLGPNGAGKSTSMKILTTYLPASSGYARLAGFDVMYQSMEVRQNIGYLPESVPIYPEMRVHEYLMYRARLKGVDRVGRNARVEYCLEKCRIKEVRNRLVGTLSKGYRQRVGLADTLLAKPAILILDEPTSGLDPVQIGETLNTIKELAGSHTVLLSTHILSEVEKVCERVIIINKGRIRFDDSLAAIAEREPTLIAEVRGPVDDVKRALHEFPGVSTVHVHPLESNLARYEVRTANRADVREPLSQKLTSHGWAIRKLDLRRESLENVFAQVVLRQDAA
jgi:ABC-2 type transport system ATP-binding protein